MRRRQGKVDRSALLLLALVSVLLFMAELRTARYRRSRFYDVKLASAKLAAQAFAAVQEYRAELGVPIDSVNDPSGSGLVGLQYSALTFGRSDLSDALTTLNPNFAAALVEMLRQAKVKSGDTIGLSWDGTYPALNVQLLAVAKSMGLVPIIVTAQSAANWGANYPGLSWLDIERVLRERGFWDYRSRLATLGGEADNGRGLSPEGRELLARAARTAGVELFNPDSLAEGIDRRDELFSRVRALVSVGRATADVGRPNAILPSRVLTRLPRRGAAGTIGWMLQRRVPVIRVRDPGRVALDFRLPLAPVRIPEPGTGRLYSEMRYSAWLALILALMMLGLTFIVVRYDIESYLGARRDISEKEAV